MGAPLVGSNVGSAVGSLVLLVGSVIASGEGSEVGLAVGGSVSEDEHDARSGTSSFPPASSTLASSDTSSRCPGATVHSSSLRARHMHRQGGATATRALGEAPRPSAQPRFRSGSLAGRGELARRPRQRVWRGATRGTGPTRAVTGAALLSSQGTCCWSSNEHLNGVARPEDARTRGIRAKKRDVKPARKTFLFACARQPFTRCVRIHALYCGRYSSTHVCRGDVVRPRGQ